MADLFLMVKFIVRWCLTHVELLVKMSFCSVLFLFLDIAQGMVFLLKFLFHYVKDDLALLL